MNRFIEFISKHMTALSQESEFLYAIIKAALSVILAFIIWLIIRKVISFIEKKRMKTESSKAGE